MSKPDIKKVYKDLDVAVRAQSKLLKEMKIDFNFAMGKQWEDEDVRTLESSGVKALTINKIKPMIKLISGIERQSRSDFVAFPEGTEDELSSEISTRLIKNVVKNSKVERKQSDQFKEGMIAGISYIEPYMDYTHDLINGDLKFRKVNASKIYPDPSGEEYDLSDRRFVIKITVDLSKDDLLQLFPDDEKKIESISMAKIDLDNIKVDTDQQFQDRDYISFFKKEGEQPVDVSEKSYDLIEYYYKGLINIYYVASATQGILIETEKKEEAEALIAANNIKDATLISRRVPEIRLKQVVGDVEFTDERCWTYPRWKSYPFMPFMAEWMTVDGLDCDLSTQGVVRGLRDLQVEYNKRRTQELRHLNSSINSGNFIPKDALSRREQEKLKKFGASPGVTIFYDPSATGGTSPQQWRISPTPLSQGHAQLALENAQDIKETSGVNSDLLSNTDKDASGRAILLRQRQGLVMVQESLDNYQHTKELLGRFILNNLGEIYTVESAMRVLGDGFIKDNFKKPKFDEQGNPMLDPNGNLETEVDMQEAMVVINKVLNDASLGKYDVSLGEGPFSETIKFANFLTLMEMAEKGVPIPPEVIIQESLLSESQKEKVLMAIEKAQQMAMKAAQMAPQPQPAEV